MHILLSASSYLWSKVHDTEVKQSYFMFDSIRTRSLPFLSPQTHHSLAQRGHDALLLHRRSWTNYAKIFYIPSLKNYYKKALAKTSWSGRLWYIRPTSALMTNFNWNWAKCVRLQWLTRYCGKSWYYRRLSTVMELSTPLVVQLDQTSLSSSIICPCSGLNPQAYHFKGYTYIEKSQ